MKVAGFSDITPTFGSLAQPPASATQAMKNNMDRLRIGKLR